MEAAEGSVNGARTARGSDQRLTEEVCDRLMENAWIDASDVSVQVGNGVVTLTGTVESEQMRHAIEDIARSIMGVGDVVDAVRVEAR